MPPLPLLKPPKRPTHADSVLVYHFADAAKVGSDSSAIGANAEGAPPPAAGALIGSGLRVFRPGSHQGEPPLPEWAPGAPLTISAWVKALRACRRRRHPQPPRWCQRLRARPQQRRALCRDQQAAQQPRSTRRCQCLDAPRRRSRCRHDHPLREWQILRSARRRHACSSKRPLEISKDSTRAPDSQATPANSMNFKSPKQPAPPGSSPLPPSTKAAPRMRRSSSSSVPMNRAIMKKKARSPSTSRSSQTSPKTSLSTVGSSSCSALCLPSSAGSSPSESSSTSTPSKRPQRSSSSAGTSISSDLTAIDHEDENSVKSLGGTASVKSHAAHA
jgi:hypothetical protein